MKYPTINRQPRREVRVPELSGGLNLRDSLTGIRDNQMTDCVNMWYKEGMLRTRPGFESNADMSFIMKDTANGKNDRLGEINCHCDIKNGDSFLTSYTCTTECYYNDSGYQYKIRFAWQSVNRIEYVNFITVDYPALEFENMISVLTVEKSYIVTKKQNIIYCFVRVGDTFRSFKWDYKQKENWEEFDELEDYYAPIVINNGVQIQGYNLLGGRYIAEWNFNNTEDPASYTLPLQIPQNSKIKVSIINSLGLIDTKTFEFTSNEDSETITNDFYNGSTKIDVVRGKISYISIYDSAGTSKQNIGTVDGGSLIGGYISVNAVCDVAADMHKLFCMTRSTWFGGTANGINGGSRLFLCGNTVDKEKNLIIWSAIDNPLYFNENNYAYVGDNSQAVTAFGQQGESLIIFKESSTYYSYYVTNTDINADELINQTVIDYEANSEYFPIVQLNNSIGCNCPDTVQLCRNRLVWTDSDGVVYSLVTKNEYSERNIYVVSDMISQRLSRELIDFLKYAVAFDFAGHYVLVVDNRAYVMDYNSYGYQYIHSYSKSDDGNIMIPWYYWELPKKSDLSVGKYLKFGNFIIAAEYQVIDSSFAIITSLLRSQNERDSDDCLYVDNNEITKKAEKINCRFRTKLFDMQASHYFKNIEKVAIGLGNNSGDEIKIEFVSNTGTETNVITLMSDSTEENNIAYVTTKSLYPCARSVRTFGVSLACKGILLVDSLSIQYRMLGGVK